MNSWDRALSNMNAVPSLKRVMPSSKIDIVNRLPPEKQYKCRHSLEKAQTAQSNLTRDTELEADLRSRRHHAQARIKALESDQGMRALFDDNHPTMVAARESLARIEQDLDFRVQKRIEHAAQANHLGRLVSNLASYLATVPLDVDLLPWTFDSDPLKKGESPDAALKDSRAVIADLQAELAGVKAAEIPRAQKKEIWHAQLESMARRAAPNVAALVKNGGQVRFATTDVSLGLAAIVPTAEAAIVVGSANGTVADALGLIAYLFPNELQAAIDAQIDSLSNDETALSDQQRQLKHQELATALLEAERHEEAIVCLIEQSGLYVQRRDDVDPRVVLEISGPAPV
jgi:hypothetical protein